MISPASNPLQLDSDCHQASCRFDVALWQHDTPQLLGLTLPGQLDSAVPKRKAEFLAGRYCAGQALDQLGNASRSAVGIGPHREPLWPKGVVGSITHTHGYAAAVVAPQDKVRAVGIDTEAWIAQTTADDIGRHVLGAGEHYDDWRHLFESAAHYLSFVFSAKESLYKCLFPLVHAFFGFHAARIIPHPAGQGRFRFELLDALNDELRQGFSGDGCYCAGDDLVHTAVVLKAANADSQK